MKPERDRRLSDIAEGAGVSLSTASRYFSGVNVRLSSREKIEKYLDSIKTAENPGGLRHLSGKRTIGLIIPVISSFFYTYVFAGIVNAANAMGYSLVTAVSERNFQQERTNLRRLSELGLDGLIYIPVGNQDGTLPDEICLFDGVPVVVANRRNVLPSRPHVYIDNINAGYIATQHLINRRRSSIGFIFSNWSKSRLSPDQLYDMASRPDHTVCGYTTIDRFRGYINALADAGIPYSPSLVSVTAWNEESGPRGVSEIVRQAPYLDGLITTADYISVSAIYTLQRLGYDVPRDVSVVGWYNTDLASLTNPMLTSIQAPLFDMGFSAVSAIDRMTSGLPQGDIVYNSSIVLRESTATRNL